MGTLRILAWLLPAVVAAGCSTVDPEQRLGQTLRAYERVVRWGELERAASFRRGGAPGWSETVRRRLRGLRVTRYDVIDGAMEEADRLYRQQVRIGYYYPDNPVERTVIDSQRWEYDAQRRKWYLVSPLPAFR